MENEKPSSKKIIINYGVILGIISVLLGVVIYVTNTYTDPHWSFTLIGILILIAVIVIGIKAYKKSNHGFLELTDALKIGIGIALIGGIIVVIWSFVLTTVIEPEYMQNVLDAQREKLLENPDMTEAMVEQSMSVMEKMSSPMIGAAFSLIGNLFLGFIFSLFAGLAMRQKQELY